MSNIKLRNPIKDGITMEQIEHVIAESDDLVIALESVAAMYGIPSTHVLSDPNLMNIRVEGDTIIAPPFGNTMENTKAIMQSIGAVIDYVSQRVDDRLNDFQNGCIAKNKLQEHLDRTSDPSKGRVVSRHVDDDGNEVIVYDTGFVDSACTPAARKFVAELREKNLIPEEKIKPNDSSYTYFTDEDDITKGTSIVESPSETPLSDELGAIAPDPVEADDPNEADGVDVSEEIDESCETLETVSEYHNSRSIGYEMMMEYGLDYVKPTLYQEADENKKVELADISYMKFDNKHILNAVKLINEVRAEQPMDKRVRINYNDLINHPKFKKAINELEAQFDCKLIFRVYTNLGKEHGSNVGTPVHDNTIKNRLTVSKSKGFQLGGTPIEIITWNHYLDKHAPDDATLFGQYTVAIMCHEIFHNIASSLRVMNNSIRACIAAGMSAAAKEKNPKNKIAVITGMIDTLDELQGFNFSKAQKKKMITELSVISTVGNVKGAKPKNMTTADRVEQHVKKVKKASKHVQHQQEISTGGTIASITGVAASIILACAGAKAWALAPLALTVGGVIMNASKAAKFNKQKKEYVDGRMNYTEENYCDMFAGMYNLPPTFFILSGGGKRYTANDLREDQLKSIYDAEKEFYANTRVKYPLAIERDYSAVKIARGTLANNKQLDPVFKKYLEWIIDNYSSTENVNVKNLYNKSTFDAAGVENLDHHLRKLIDENNISITEYDLSWMNDFMGEE